MQPPPPPPEAATIPRRAIPHHPARILVADDRPDAAARSALALSSLAFTVVGPAADGRRAVELARVASPDLALLTFNLPITAGHDAARTLLHQLNIPCILIAVPDDDLSVSIAAASGAFASLAGHPSPAQLRAAVATAWARFRDRAAAAARVDSLNSRLEQRTIIERAKWIIVRRRAVSEDDAFRLMHEQARATQRPVVEIARAIIEAGPGPA